MLSFDNMIITAANGITREALTAEEEALAYLPKARIGDNIFTYAQTIEAVCKLKGEVDFTEPGNLPNDGKVIAYIRDHD